MFANFFPPSSDIDVKSAIVMLHGYGSDGNDMLSMAPILAENLKNTLFFAPDAPQRVENGFKWFDLDVEESPTVMERFMYIERLMQKALIVVPKVQDFIRQIQKEYKIPFEKIVLLGFSQGGLLALMSGLTFPKKVGGIVACSSIPLAINTAMPIEKVMAKPPVLLTHGLADDMVPFVGEQVTENTLKNIDVPVETHTVPGMGHMIDNSCLSAIKTFLDKVLS